MSINIPKINIPNDSTHQFRNIPRGGVIGNFPLTDGHRFDGRMGSVDTHESSDRIKLSVNWALQYLNSIYRPDIKFTASNIHRPKIANGPNILIGSNEEDYVINPNGIYISKDRVDGLILRNSDEENTGKILGLGTADCGNVLFQGPECSGIIHIGHQGFFGEDAVGIIENLAKVLRSIEGNDLSKYKFSLGPMAKNLTLAPNFLIPERFNSYKKEIHLLNPDHQLRKETFDRVPSDGQKQVIQFQDLVVKHLCRTLEIDGTQIELANIDTANGNEPLPSPKWFSNRRQGHLPKEIRDKEYGNNLTYLCF